MPKWNFINGLTEKHIKKPNKKWSMALEASLKSKATPDQSNYYSNCGAVTRSGHAVYGSNHEIGITETITHGEEAVIARALDDVGREDPIEVIAFTKPGEAGIASPCGNCRDAIKKYTDLEKLMIVCGPPEGGRATAVPGKAYFFENFKKASRKDFDRILESEALREALFAESSAYDIYLNGKTSPPIYGAAIVSIDGEIFRGSYRGDAAYHSIYPISSAIEALRNKKLNKMEDIKRFNLKEIILANSSEILEIPYKDRQHALEFFEATRTADNIKKPLPIYLVKAKANEYAKSQGLLTYKIKQLYRTNSKEWLPLPFSPRHLGLDEIISQDYQCALINEARYIHKFIEPEKNNYS